MAIDLNEDPPPSDNDGVVSTPTWTQQQDHPGVHLHHGANNEQENTSEFGGFFDLNIAYETDNESVDINMDTFNAAAEAASFDLNSNFYESWSDDDAHVYTEDFHVTLGEENLQQPSVEAPSEQGMQHETATVKRKRKNLSDKRRQEIYEELLLRSNNGKIKRTTTTSVAVLFNVNRCYVQSIWRDAKKCRAAGVPVNVHSKRKKACGRHKATIDLSRVLTIPLHKRTTLKALAEALGVNTTSLHRLFKEGKLRRHSNTLKPYLREDNKKERLKYCMAMVDAQTVLNDPKFIDMKNIIHIDEKWFNTTKKAKKFYMLPEEEDPLRTIHNKNSIPKCMLLCGVALPRYNSAGTCYFDGKIGIWPFVRKV